MLLFSSLLLITRLLSLIAAAAARSPRSEFARNVYLPLDLNNNDSLSNAIKQISLPLSLELNTTDNTKAFHVPNTYITLLWTPVSDQPIEYKLLCNLIKDAIIEVTNVIKHFGDSLLPDNKDPYIDVKYVGKAPAGAYIRMQSPVDGPAYGRKLTWGNVKDTLSGLRDIMIKEGRTYKIYFEIRNDNLGLIGRGCVAPGEPTSPLPRLGDGVDEQS